MFKQVRTLLGEVNPIFTSQVELEETYVGGVRRGKTGRGAEGKVAVIGIYSGYLPPHAIPQEPFLS
jgi:transposase-like protein